MTKGVAKWHEGQNAFFVLPHVIERMRRQCSHGGTYSIEILDDRSDEEHNHYFACIKKAHDNLPDFYAARWLTTEHLRKKLLIDAGYYDEVMQVASSPNEAMVLALFANRLDDYAVVTIADCVVRVWTAKSQKKTAMHVDTFRASKRAVLERCADLIGVPYEELTATEQAA